MLGRTPPQLGESIALSPTNVAPDRGSLQVESNLPGTTLMGGINYPPNQIRRVVNNRIGSRLLL